MKVLTRDRVVPIISASVSWLIFAMTGSGFRSLPKLAIRRSTRARRFSLDNARHMDWNGMERSFFMNAILGRTALALAIVMATLPANAKGCIKGAIVGGAAGHIAGHPGLMGAAAGCAIGHHEAKKNEKAAQSPH